MLKRYLTIALIAITFGVAGWFIYRHHKKVDADISSPILAPAVREKIIVDPRRNKMTVITRERTDTLFLPDRPTAIEIPYKGKIRIERRTWGFEFAPFGSVFFTDKLMVGAGADGVYWHKFNFGSGMATNVTRLFDIRFFSHISYNLYSNTSLGLVIDSQKNLGMDLSFRF